uniref:Uncharacterized protein n=1 Tax=Oryza glaberrima TaxID=4538 RepID=I1PZI7_ORYGL
MQRTKSAQPKKLILATTLLSNSPHCSRSPHPGHELAEKHSASATGGRRRLSSLRRRCRLCFSDSRGCRLAQVLNPIAHEVVLKITGFGGCGGLTAAAAAGAGVLASATEGGGGAGRRWGSVSARGRQQLQSAAMRRQGGVGEARGVAAAADLPTTAPLAHGGGGSPRAWRQSSAST